MEKSHLRWEQPRIKTERDDILLLKKQAKFSGRSQSLAAFLRKTSPKGGEKGKKSEGPAQD